MSRKGAIVCNVVVRVVVTSRLVAFSFIMISKFILGMKERKEEEEEAKGEARKKEKNIICTTLFCVWWCKRTK